MYVYESDINEIAKESGRLGPQLSISCHQTKVAVPELAYIYWVSGQTFVFRLEPAVEQRKRQVHFTLAFDLFRRCQAMTAQTDWEWHLLCLKASAMFFASPSTFPCTETSCFFPTFPPHLTPTPASLGEFSSWDLYWCVQTIHSEWLVYCKTL